MLTKEQRDEILRLVMECVAVGNEGGGKQGMALCDYLDSITAPEGWQMVPVEPTDRMKTAGIDVEVYADSAPQIDALTWAEASAIYKAMLAAAPKPGDSNE